MSTRYRSANDTSSSTYSNHSSRYSLPPYNSVETESLNRPRRPDSRSYYYAPPTQSSRVAAQRGVRDVEYPPTFSDPSPSKDKKRRSSRNMDNSSDKYRHGRTFSNRSSDQKGIYRSSEHTSRSQRHRNNHHYVNSRPREDSDDEVDKDHHGRHKDLSTIFAVGVAAAGLMLAGSSSNKETESEIESEEEKVTAKKHRRPSRRLSLVKDSRDNLSKDRIRHSHSPSRYEARRPTLPSSMPREPDFNVRRSSPTKLPSRPASPVRPVTRPRQPPPTYSRASSSATSSATSSVTSQSSRHRELVPNPASPFEKAKLSMSTYNKWWRAQQASPPHDTPTRKELKTLPFFSDDEKDWRLKAHEFFCFAFGLTPVVEKGLTGLTCLTFTTPPQNPQTTNQSLIALRNQLKQERVRWHEDKLRHLFGEDFARDERCMAVWGVVRDLQQNVERALEREGVNRA